MVLHSVLYVIKFFYVNTIMSSMLLQLVGYAQIGMSKDYRDCDCETGNNNNW